jgi:hypothetical protein
VKPALALRLLALVGVALVAGLAAYAVILRQDDEASSAALPVAAPAPGGGWFKARAAALPAPRKTRRTDCSVALSAKTLGVAHPVLPCRAQLYVEFGDRRVLTRVIGRGAPGRSEFGITRALAEKLDLHGVKQIRWRFAVAAD